MSPLARLGVAALVGVGLAGAPTARALAADHRDHRDDTSTTASASDDDAPITALGEQLATHRRAASERLRGLVQAAVQHAAQHVHEARDGMTRAIESRLEALASLAASEPDDAAAVERERPRRFEYVEATNDPLAGL